VEAKGQIYTMLCIVPCPAAHLHQPNAILAKQQELAARASEDARCTGQLVQGDAVGQHHWLLLSLRPQREQAAGEQAHCRQSCCSGAEHPADGFWRCRGAGDKLHNYWERQCPGGRPAAGPRCWTAAAQRRFGDGS